MHSIKVYFKNVYKKYKTFSIEDKICLIISISLIFALIGFFVLDYILEVAGLTIFKQCAMKQIFGIPCPGCGGTRAIKCLLSGDILNAIYYNAFAVYSIIGYLIFLISQILQKLTKGKIKGIKFKNWYIFSALVVLVIQYIIKLVLPEYTI